MATPPPSAEGKPTREKRRKVNVAVITFTATKRPILSSDDSLYLKSSRQASNLNRT
jgi:hypothetical protein